MKSRSVSRRAVAYIATIALVGGVLAFAAAPVMAYTTQGSCSVSDTTKVLLYENTTTDHSDGDDRLWLCGSDSNLHNNWHSLPGTCQSAVYPFANAYWYDCASSIQIWIPSGWSVCVYRDANPNAGDKHQEFTGPISGTRFNLRDELIQADDITDAASSLYITQSNC